MRLMPHMDKDTGKFHAAALNIPYYNLTELKFKPDLVEQAK